MQKDTMRIPLKNAIAWCGNWYELFRDKYNVCDKQVVRSIKMPTAGLKALVAKAAREGGYEGIRFYLSLENIHSPQQVSLVSVLTKQNEYIAGGRDDIYNIYDLTSPYPDQGDMSSDLYFPKPGTPINLNACDSDVMPVDLNTAIEGVRNWYYYYYEAFGSLAKEFLHSDAFVLRSFKVSLREIETITELDTDYIRLYFVNKVPASDAMPIIGLILVTVNNDGQDNLTPLPEITPPIYNIFDFTSPCPDQCDIGSPLYISRFLQARIQVENK